MDSGQKHQFFFFEFLRICSIKSIEDERMNILMMFMTRINVVFLFFIWSGQWSWSVCVWVMFNFVHFFSFDNRECFQKKKSREFHCCCCWKNQKKKEKKKRNSCICHVEKKNISKPSWPDSIDYWSIELKKMNWKKSNFSFFFQFIFVVLSRLPGW